MKRAKALPFFRLIFINPGINARVSKNLQLTSGKNGIQLFLRTAV
jgi:hypothetical protein